MKMQRRVVQSILGALIGAIVIPAELNAKPFVYTSVFSYDSTYKVCLRNAKELLRKNGFDRFEDDDINIKSRRAATTAYHESEYITVDITCYQKHGITSLAVSGLDNDLTYRIYEKFYNSSW